jgi:hypothetical protein
VLFSIGPALLFGKPVEIATVLVELSPGHIVSTTWSPEPKPELIRPLSGSRVFEPRGQLDASVAIVPGERFGWMG